ncbi:hypothetical protein TWF506_004801 [Arthrobotrys conoides]|uniref:F-box domain-containing protein n=1 Tax=Arthrobotrys conoides TaxID=74498 RepID=A0AAN8RPC7_9PEZI
MPHNQDTCFSRLSAGVTQSILSYLCHQDQIAFARCSKKFYSLASPTIFDCVKIYNKKTAELFGEGRRLEFARKYVRSVKLWVTYKYESTGPMLQAIAVFPNLSELEIRVETPGRFELERNIYAAVISLLSTMPYYEGLRQLAFVSRRKAASYRALCGGTELLSDVSTDYEFSDKIYKDRIEGKPGETIAIKRYKMERNRRENYKRLWSKLSPENQKFLGPFLSNKEFKKLVSDKLHFPKNVESLKIWTTGYAHTFCLPLTNCKTLTKLSLNQAKYPIMGDYPSAHILQLPQVKILRLEFSQNPDLRYLAHLPTQYPDLEVLEIRNNDVRNYWDSCDQDILTYIPNFPKVVKMTIPWPRIPTGGAGGYSMSKGIYRMEIALGGRIEKGDFRALQKVKMFGTRLVGGTPDETNVTCLVSKEVSNQNGLRRFKWEGDTWDYYDTDRSDIEASPESLYVRDEEEAEDRLKIRRGIIAGEYWHDKQLEYYETSKILVSRRAVGKKIQTTHGPLVQLPTEIIYLILKNLGSYYGKPLSRCCRRFYFLMFPDRVRGVMFNRHGYHNGRYIARYKYSPRDLRPPDDGPGGNSAHLQRFDEGRCFASLRQYIQTARFYALDILDVSVGLPLAAQFSNVTKIKIWVKYSRGVERQLYAAILACLPTLSCYSNLKHIIFVWKGSDRSSESDGNSSDESDSPSKLCADNLRTDFESTVKNASPQEKQILTKFISHDALPKVLWERGLGFPKSLRYLKLDITEFEPSFCLALVHCKALVALHITVRSPSSIIIMDSRAPNIVPEFLNMKALALYFPNGYDGNHLSHLAKQFPNLEKLYLPPPNKIRNTSWISSIPNLKKLEYLELPWPGSPGTLEAIPSSRLETDLAERLTAGDFPALEIAKVSQKYDWYGNPGYRNAFATISRVSNDQENTEDSHWKAEWEVNRITENFETRAKRLNRMCKNRDV